MARGATPTGMRVCERDHFEKFCKMVAQHVTTFVEFERKAGKKIWHHYHGDATKKTNAVKFAMCQENDAGVTQYFMDNALVLRYVTS